MIEKLEYNKILNILSTYCKTYIGNELAINLSPSYKKSSVEKALNETSNAISLIYRKGKLPIVNINNIDVFIKQLNSNSAISPIGLLNIAKILKLSRELKNYFFDDEKFDLSEYINLENYFNNLYCNENLENKILSCIIDENTIADDASKTLYNLRTTRKNTESEIKDKLSGFIHSSSYSKYIMDPIVTIRNDRYVIPVKSEYKDKIKGLLHDTSSTGSTVFIEPLSVFELNNKINNIKLEENIEIEKILFNLSESLFSLTENIQNNVNLIGILDLIFAKATYSIDINGIQPILNDSKQISLIQAKHPLIDKNIVVPISIEIGKEYNSLVITGPNTGGKTVTLKTVGLLCLMAYSGIHIPAKTGSTIFVFDTILADIGDEQSISDSLSTFSSHMTNIIKIFNIATQNSLILFDELGAGTDPIEGALLAISILDYFQKLGAITLSTTHYQELKNYALTTSGFKNASVEFDLENLKPTYRLLIGIPGKSNAFEISQKLGLNSKILNNAKSLLKHDSVHLEDLIKQIYDDKIIIEKEKEEIQNNSNQIKDLREKLEKQLSELSEKENTTIEKAKQQAREILLSAKEEANSIIQELNTIYNNIDTQSLKNANNLRNKLNTKLSEINSQSNKESNNRINTIKPEDITIGMTVFSNKFKQNATVLSSINKSNEVQLQIGIMKTNVNINDLSYADTDSKKITKTADYSNRKSKINTKKISNEINVIGNNVEDAIWIIDKYIDDCALAGLTPIRIVHGKGTGKLRDGIHAFLKKNKHVKSFRLGTFGEGEMGVTVVELKI